MDDIEGVFLTLARNGEVEKLNSLLQSNVDLDINCKGKSKSNREWTALHLCSYFGHVDVVSHLLSLGAKPNICNSVGDTPLHRAAFTSREEVVHKLLEYNADATVQNDERNKPSDVACNSEIRNILKAAERVQGIKLAEKMFLAAKEGNVETIVDLLKTHPEIVNANTQDDLGNTPLHYAAMRGNRSVAVYLLQHGGDSSIANKEGRTALDVCRTSQLSRLLDVQPIKHTVKNVQRFEGFLYRKHLLRPRLHWVVLEQGVLSYFARHADAVTGTKRRMFKYLTDAAVTVKEDNNTAFQIEFFDTSVHYLQVRKDPRAHISRQKWVQAIQLHIDYSSHYAKVGKVQESDSEDEEDLLPLVDIQNTVETGFAHNELLKKQIDEFAVSAHKMAMADTSRNAQLLLGKCHQILSISNELTTSFSMCLTTLQRQDEVRKVQVQQERETTRVWQQAFEALAAEHHNLERTISIHSPESLAMMTASSANDGNFQNLNGGASSPISSVSGVSDEDFYDAFDESEEENEFSSSPKQGADTSSSKSQMNDNLNNLSRNPVSEKDNSSDTSKVVKHIELPAKILHYEHTHAEVSVTSGYKQSRIIDDVESIEQTVNGSHGRQTTHVEKKYHVEKEVRRKSDGEKSEREASLSSSFTSESDSRQFRDCVEFVYREKLPVVMFSRDSFSFWSILKKCIGKELSKITMPVIFNEPLSFLQRLCEYMEYTFLLRKACEQSDSIERLQYIAAFAVSALASQLARVGKPYNPLLGETFECNRPDLGFHWVSEQVSHHPPVSAFHVTGTDSSFSFHGSIHPKLKFWGKSVEVEPRGVMTLTLHKFDETYTWNNPHCSVHNVVVGKPWIEQHGMVEITNHKTKEKCVLNFKSHSWFRNDLNKVEGYIMNSNKTKQKFLEGDWTKHLYSLTPDAFDAFKDEINPHHRGGRERKGSSSKAATASEALQSLTRTNEECQLLWKVQPRPAFSTEYYSFTSFAMTLNQFKDGEEEILPPSDTRWRPDIRCQENGDIDGAGDEKWRLEEKQRAARKVRAKHKEEFIPRWFKCETNPATNLHGWVFNDKYKDADWSLCPDIFGSS